MGNRNNNEILINRFVNEVMRRLWLCQFPTRIYNQHSNLLQKTNNYTLLIFYLLIVMVSGSLVGSSVSIEPDMVLVVPVVGLDVSCL